MVGIKATLYDGSYHPVDSSEMSFKIAASLAYKNGIPQANPVLLEPVGTLKALCNDEAMGDIIGDINKRRGRVLGMTPQGNGIRKFWLKFLSEKWRRSRLPCVRLLKAEAVLKLNLHATKKCLNTLLKKLLKTQKKNKIVKKNIFLLDFFIVSLLLKNNRPLFKQRSVVLFFVIYFL